MVKVCFLLLLACCGCVGSNDTVTGTANASQRRVAISPIINPGPTPEEYGMQVLELAITWRDSLSDTTQTPMGDEEFVARAAAIIREAQATGCADGIQ